MGGEGDAFQMGEKKRQKKDEETYETSDSQINRSSFGQNTPSDELYKRRERVSLVILSSRLRIKFCIQEVHRCSLSQSAHGGMCPTAKRLVPYMAREKIAATYERSRFLDPGVL